ncbi:MAG: hypothetical protein LC777_20105, partial [Actinobacteria bacterium]|nr:hypothetical protein [Actinomycetota bacterium]
RPLTQPPYGISHLARRSASCAVAAAVGRLVPAFLAERAYCLCDGTIIDGEPCDFSPDAQR